MAFEVDVIASSAEVAAEDQIEKHMSIQPYEILCSDCSSELTVHSREVDCDNDLKITVDPCKHCMHEATL